MPQACPAPALHSLATVIRDPSARDSEKEVLAGRNVSLKDNGKYQVENEVRREQSQAGQGGPLLNTQMEPCLKLCRIIPRLFL